MMTRMYYDRGVTSSDKDILKKEIMRRVVYKAANNIMTGRFACVLENFDSLDLKLSLPKVTMLTPERVKEGSRAGLQTIEWFDVNETMEKEQLKIQVTYEAKARQLSGMQSKYSLIAAARGLAWSKDTDIFTTLIAASAGTDPASGVWTDPTTDIASDLGETVGNILLNADITEEDIPNIGIYYPVQLWPRFQTPIQIGTIQQTIKNWIQAEFKMSFYPTKQLTTTVMACLKSSMNATHMTYTGPDIPLVEMENVMGVGDEYLVTQLFKTFIVPEAEGGTTNNMIRIISGVDV
jgi:hypothetical protein